MKAKQAQHKSKMKQQKFIYVRLLCTMQKWYFGNGLHLSDSWNCKAFWNDMFNYGEHLLIGVRFKITCADYDVRDWSIRKKKREKRNQNTHRQRIQWKRIPIFIVSFSFHFIKIKRTMNMLRSDCLFLFFPLYQVIVGSIWAYNHANKYTFISYIYGVQSYRFHGASSFAYTQLTSIIIWFEINQHFARTDQILMLIVTNSFVHMLVMQCNKITINRCNRWLTDCCCVCVYVVCFVCCVLAATHMQSTHATIACKHKTHSRLLWLQRMNAATGGWEHTFKWPSVWISKNLIRLIEYAYSTPLTCPHDFENAKKYLHVIEPWNV